GIKSGRLGLSYLALGRALVGLKETEEARRALASAVDQMRPTMGSDHRQTKLAQRLLADIGSGHTPPRNPAAATPPRPGVGRRARPVFSLRFSRNRTGSAFDSRPRHRSVRWGEAAWVRCG